jgi:hypothetical protein
MPILIFKITKVQQHFLKVNNHVLDYFIIFKNFNIACHANSKQSFIEILKYQPNLDLKDNKGNTLLHYSVVQYDDYLESLYLIRAGANKFIVDKEGLSIYDYVKKTHPNISKFYKLIIENDDDSVNKELN